MRPESDADGSRAAQPTPALAAGLARATDMAEVVAAHAGCALVDHRIYTIALRRMGEFVEVFDRLAMPILLQTLGRPLGFWTSLVGPQNQFIHLWGYASLADYEQRCLARDSHPGFGAYLKASEHLIVAQETRLIRRLALPSLSLDISSSASANVDPHVDPASIPTSTPMSTLRSA